MRIERQAIAQRIGQDFEHAERLDTLCLRRRQPEEALAITLDHGEQMAA